jgi:hypothetical protein
LALQSVENVVSNIYQVAECLLTQDRIVAVGLLTRRDLNLLGPTFDRVWPVEDAPSFGELIRAIDEADERLMRAESSSPQRES